MTSIAVTGHSGFIGQRVIASLREMVAPRRIVGVDIRPSPLRAPWLVDIVKDVRDPSLARDFRDHKVTTVVHLAFVLNPSYDENAAFSVDVGGTENILACALNCGATHVVAMSSATAYGARPENPIPLREDAPLMAPATFPYAHHKRLLEERCEDLAAKHPEITVATIRPCIVLGPAVKNYIASALTALPVAPLIDGADNFWQFVADDDVAKVIALVVRATARGAFNVAGDGLTSGRAIAQMRGVPVIGIPGAWARRLNDFFWTRRLFPGYVAPTGIIDYFRYPWVLDTTRTRGELGFTPTRSSAALMSDLIERDRRAGDATPRRSFLGKARQVIDVARHGTSW